MRGAVTPQHMLCTGTAVTSYTNCKVICKIAGSHSGCNTFAISIQQSALSQNRQSEARNTDPQRYTLTGHRSNYNTVSWHSDSTELQMASSDLANYFTVSVGSNSCPCAQHVVWCYSSCHSKPFYYIGLSC